MLACVFGGERPGGDGEIMCRVSSHNENGVLSSSNLFDFSTDGCGLQA